MIGLGAGVLAFLYWKQQKDSSTQDGSSQDGQGVGISDVSSFVDSVYQQAADVATNADDFLIQNVGFSVIGRNWLSIFNKAENATYKALLGAAEDRYSIPRNVLSRLAYQESRFRQDIIDGSTVSRAGAMGIMQIIPKWNPGVNPLDPGDAIDYAGKKLAGLFRMFGTWELALQAYNWGEGNLKKYLNGEISSLPAETANYSRQILADAGSSSVYA